MAALTFLRGREHRFYQFEHIVSYSSGKVVDKVTGKNPSLSIYSVFDRFN